MEISTKPEFPIWSSNSRIVRFSCVGHNEFATSADPGIDHDDLYGRTQSEPKQGFVLFELTPANEISLVDS